MTDTYFDVVVCKLDGVPIFNGTPDEVKAWLEENKDDSSLACAHVCEGKTLKYSSIEKYVTK